MQNTLDEKPIFTSKSVAASFNDSTGESLERSIEIRTNPKLRIVLVVRSNYAPWVRNDHTGFEVMRGDTAAFAAPELTAQMARRYRD